MACKMIILLFPFLFPVFLVHVFGGIQLLTVISLAYCKKVLLCPLCPYKQFVRGIGFCYQGKFRVETVVDRYIIDGVWTTQPDGSKVWESFKALEKKRRN